MAEDDIYGSRRKYEQFKARLAQEATLGARKYQCTNPANLKYYPILFRHFEARDLSFIRRVRLLQSMRVICHLTPKALGECNRDDIDSIVAQMHDIYKTPKSKETFIADVKYFWRILFPDVDEKGRPDESKVTPHSTRIPRLYSYVL